MSNLDISEATLPITDATPRLDGAMLPERVLQEVLKLGFDALKNDQTIFDDLLHKLDLDTRNDIKSFYSDNDVAVRLNFPRDALKFPIVAIVNQSEDDDPNLALLNNHMDIQYSYGSGNAVNYVGVGQKCNYQIYCLAGKDSNAVLWLTYIVKAILLVNINELHKHGLHNISFTGRDITLREDLFTEFTYGRIVGVTCDTFFGVRLTEKVANTIQVRLLVTGVDT